MRIWTKKAIIDKVESDLDLQDEVLVTASEMTGYLNEAIQDCAAIIEKLDEDYFLRKASLALVSGQSLYTLPADIYASKIRGIIYRNGALRFPIKRIRPYDEFERATEIDLYPEGNPSYQYILVNTDGPTGVQIELHPASQETSSTNVTLWYLREAATLTNDSDVCDIPEGINYIFAHMKKSCMAKEALGLPPEEAEADLEKQEKRLIDSLSNRVPDNDNTIQLDTSFYWEHT